MTITRVVGVVLVGLSGLALALSALPRFRRPVLSRRLLPYLGALGPRRSNLVAPDGMDSGWAAVLAPVCSTLADRLSRLLGDGLDLPERLAAAGTTLDVSGFRLEQVTWGLVGGTGGAALAGLALGAGRAVSPVLVVGMIVAFGAAGFVARDRALTRAGQRRRVEARAALPTVVDLVCLAVTAGESLRASLVTVAEAGGGPIGDELRIALRATGAGTPLVAAMAERARLLGLAPFDRFVDAVGAAQERGIPLADALRSLAFELREEEKRALIEVAGRKQVSMLVPVVSLILPVAIVFAFYPGVVAIRTLAR